jgi:hypothetical protein
MRVALIGNYPFESTQIKGGVQAAFVYLVNGGAGLVANLVFPYLDQVTRGHRVGATGQSCHLDLNRHRW